MGSTNAAGEILVLGAGGLLGRALRRVGPVRALPREELDITDEEAVRAALDRLRPTAVVNAAALARVDLAEREPERAVAVNHLAVESLARACQERGVALLHIGTDYSLRAEEDLHPAMAPDPQGVYATSKSRGEQAALGHGATVVRVQWLYDAHAPCFFSRCLRALERGEALSLVTDQWGSPTPVSLLAPRLLAAARHPRPGLYHLACGGATTPWAWIEAAARRLDLPFRGVPITRAALGGAPRPRRSVLGDASFRAAFGEGLPPWEEALALALAEPHGL